MAGLAQCSDCRGFLPNGQATCPNCGGQRSSRAWARAGAVLAGSAAALSSCIPLVMYGPMYVPDCTGPCDADAGPYEHVCRAPDAQVIYCCPDGTTNTEGYCPEATDAGSDAGPDAGADAGS